MRALVLVLCVASLAACFDPSFDELACDLRDECPPGYVCVDGGCHPLEETAVLTVALGSTDGMVVGDGIACGDDCTTRVVRGTVILLTAVPSTIPAHASTFAGWDRTACTDDQLACTVTVDDDREVRATFTRRPNLAFVTSTLHTGDLGGTAGADAICAARATEAGLAGTYRAWLSTPREHAIERLGDASGWVRVDGKHVARSRDELAGSSLVSPLRLDERGRDVGDAELFTGGGFASKNTCADWTAADAGLYGYIGRASDTGWGWSAHGLAPCDTPRRLACIGSDRDATMETPDRTPVPLTARVAFLSIERFWPQTGLAGADAICAGEAAAAGLTGTFRALIARNGASALSRFTSGGAVVRPDGVEVATASAFATGALWEAPINLTAQGWSNGAYAATGAPDPRTPGTYESTCGGWTLASGGFMPFGMPSDTAVAGAFAQWSTPCDADMHLGVYCLED